MTVIARTVIRLLELVFGFNLNYVFKKKNKYTWTVSSAWCDIMYVGRGKLLLVFNAMEVYIYVFLRTK